MVLAFVLFLTLQSTTFAKEVVRISTGEWAPYISESEPSKGILAQITVEAFALKGVTVDLEFFPWGRATHLSKTGERDGTIALVRLTEREPFYLFSESLYVGHYAFFHLKSVDFKWKEYSDLKNMTIASTIGFGGMGEEFMQAEKEGLIKVLRLSSDAQSFNMLLAKRADAVPSDVEVGYVLGPILSPTTRDNIL